MLLTIAPDHHHLEYLLSQVSILTTACFGNVTIYSVDYRKTTFILVESGYGKVNQARALTLAFSLFPISSVLSIGTAGDLCLKNPELFTAVIGVSTFQYDVDFTQLGEPIATLPDMETGMFDAPDNMITFAVNAAEATQTMYRKGTIACADRFLSNPVVAERLSHDFMATAVDAECAAVAQAAYLNDIPSIGMKIICDSATWDAPTQYMAYAEEAIFISQNVALAYMDQLIIS